MGLSYMNLSIEVATSEDLAAINDIYNHYVLNSNATFDTEAWPLERRIEWFKQFNNSGSSYHLFVAKQDGEVVAFAYNGKFKEKLAYYTSSEVTVYVKPGVVKSGVGSQMYQHLIAAIEGSEIHRLYACIALPNEASIKLHEKFGFTLIGTMDEVGYKNGSFHSVAWYEKKL